MVATRNLRLTKAQRRMLDSVRANQPLFYEDLYKVTRGQRATLDKLHDVGLVRFSEYGIVTVTEKGKTMFAIRRSGDDSNG